jgi:hypothetical protein
MNIKTGPEKGLFRVSKYHQPKKGVNMVLINPGSINDLRTLVDAGVPVTLTSHPGNASLYKMSLWSSGIPEHLWDVTCAKADANNWPMHMIAHGESKLLLSSELHERILRETTPHHRFVVAYQRTVCGERLGRFHVRVMEQLFPHAISTCSRLLLSEAGRIEEMFEFLAETRSDVFTRFIGGDGIMRPIAESGISSRDYASSCMGVLRELDRLLLSDEQFETVGGACYDGVVVQLAGMLVRYWQTGEIVRYDISGPDMIHYATRPAYMHAMQEMLLHLRQWNTALVPKRFDVHMFPGTLARVGHIPGHVSQKVMERKQRALTTDGVLPKDEKRMLRQEAHADGALWPTVIDPRKGGYFTQHDLAALGGHLAVDPYWKDVSFFELKTVLERADGLLQVKRS